MIPPIITFAVNRFGFCFSKQRTFNHSDILLPNFRRSRIEDEGLRALRISLLVQTLMPDTVNPARRTETWCRQYINH